METCPKPAVPRPVIDGRQPPRLAIEAKKPPSRGAYLAYLSLFQLNFAAAPAVYRPVGLAPGLSLLS
jgi:hypothetical protein